MLDKNVSKIIRQRRSIYPSQFIKKKINKKVIIELLKNANTAPSHKLTQPWFFKIFSGSSKKRLAHELIKIKKIEDTKVKDKIFNNFYLSSHILCICSRKSELIPEWEEIAATSMAVQNIWISCSNTKNIGGYWSTPKNIQKINKFLKLKKNEECLGIFYIGVYENLNHRKIKRKNIMSDTEWFN